jgi:hypothetical protein
VNAVCVHESNHAVAGYWHGRDVDHVWRAVGTMQAGETVGHADIPFDNNGIDAIQVVIALVGYLGTDERDWPPPWPEALDEPLEALGLVLRHLDADEEQYTRMVQYCRELLEDPDFIRLRDSIARALSRVPRLERETIEKLAEIHFNHEPEGVTA